MLRQILLAMAAITLWAGPAVPSQEVLHRTVGPGASGRPLEFSGFTVHLIGALSEAAGIPIGFEALPGRAAAGTGRPIVLTGRTVGDAIAAMTALDPRYSSREEDGVILFEPATPGALLASPEQPDVSHPLDAPAPAARLGEITSREAFRFVTALLGASGPSSVDPSDTKPFILETPEGTIRALLNGIVRSHGQLAWVFQPVGDDSLSPFTLTFMSGMQGLGRQLSGRRPAENVDPGGFVRNTPAGDILNAIVGTRRDGYPLVLTRLGPSTAWDLSAATQIPIGMQVAPGVPPNNRVSAPEFTASGRTLRDVLDTLMATDTRYQWRVVEGTIVIRPVRAWNDASDVLFALVRPVDLRDVPMTDAMRAVLSAFGAPNATALTSPDSRSVSLSVGQVTALELLAALARSHGSLSWTLADAEPEEVRSTGLRHRLTLLFAGVGHGTLVR